MVLFMMDMFNTDMIKTKEFIRIELVASDEHPNMFINFQELAISNEINLHSKQESKDKFVCYINKNNYSVVQDFFIENFNL